MEKNKIFNLWYSFLYLNVYTKLYHTAILICTIMTCLIVKYLNLDLSAIITLDIEGGNNLRGLIITALAIINGFYISSLPALASHKNIEKLIEKELKKSFLNKYELLLIHYIFGFYLFLMSLIVSIIFNVISNSVNNVYFSIITLGILFMNCFHFIEVCHAFVKLLNDLSKA